MKIDVLRSAGIDYEYGTKRFAGRANLFEKALAKFLRDSAFARLRAAYEQGDRQGVLASAHEFKGMCGNIGLTSLYEASDAIVRLLRADSCSAEELSAAYALLDERYAAIFAAISASMEETL